MDKIDYTKLYALQDTVASIVCSTEGDYYLTGGTCLNRFYHEGRYSDDLDFFYSDAALFREWVRELRDILTQTGNQLDVKIDSRDFVRISINETLKVDLVNDRVYRFGKTVTHNTGIKLDNILNILANKLTAIIGRDEPKDVFDFYTIVSTERFEWSEIIGAAEKKSMFAKDELVTRLESFPDELFDRLNVLPTYDLASVKKGLKKSIIALIAGNTNLPWR